MCAAVQRRAVSAHQARYVRPDNLHAHLVFKGAEYGLVVECAALHHYLAAQLLRGGGADNLVERVAHYGYGQARGDVLQCGAVLLRLFDAGIHEHCAAAAQVHRPVGKQAQAGKLLHPIAQGLGEGLQKTATAGGTGLVEEYIADSAVGYLEALHVLAADIDYEVHVGQEMPRRREMRHGLDKAEVRVESVLRQFLAVARGSDGTDGEVRMFREYAQQRVAYERHRVAQVGAVVGEEQPALFVYDSQLNRGGAGIYAYVHPAAV